MPQVLVGELVLDYSVYPRNSVNYQHVARLSEALRAGATLPPVRACAKTKRVVDGFHRTSAALKVNGPTAVVEAEFVEYADEAAFFLDSVRLNSAHGLNLSAYDTAKCRQIAERIGAADDALAAALNLRVSKFDSVTQRHTAFAPDGTPAAIKRPLVHLAQKQLTTAQVQANQRAGGQPVAFYVNQMVNAIEGEIIDRSDVGLMSKLRDLHAKLGEFIG